MQKKTVSQCEVGLKQRRKSPDSLECFKARPSHKPVMVKACCPSSTQTKYLPKIPFKHEWPTWQFFLCQLAHSAHFTRGNQWPCDWPGSTNQTTWELCPLEILSYRWPQRGLWFQVFSYWNFMTMSKKALQIYDNHGRLPLDASHTPYTFFCTISHILLQIAKSVIIDFTCMLKWGPAHAPLPMTGSTSVNKQKQIWKPARVFKVDLVRSLRGGSTLCAGF